MGERESLLEYESYSDKREKQEKRFSKKINKMNVKRHDVISESRGSYLQRGGRVRCHPQLFITSPAQMARAA